MFQGLFRDRFTNSAKDASIRQTDKIGVPKQFDNSGFNHQPLNVSHYKIRIFIGLDK